MPKETRIIDSKRWRVAEQHRTGWYWIICVDNKNDVRRLSSTDWYNYPAV